MSEEQYHRVLRVKDERFDIEQLGHYHLIVQSGNDRLRLLVVDTQDHRALLLEEFSFKRTRSVAELIEVFGKIYDNHHVLKAGYWGQITVCFRNPVFTLVPQELYQSGEPEAYLKPLVTLREKQETILEEHLQRQNSVLLFVVPSKLLSWFQEKHAPKAIEHTHQSRALCEACLKSSTEQEGPLVDVYVESGYFYLTVAKDGQLLFCNRFFYHEVSDFTYFLMLTLEELGLPPESVPVRLFGEVHPESPLYRKIMTYLGNVTFGQRPEELTFGFYFDELMEHRFRDLFAVHLFSNSES